MINANELIDKSIQPLRTVKGVMEMNQITQEKPLFLQYGILLGLRTIVPEEVERSGILESPERRKVVNALGDYQVRLNDYVDFLGAGRPELQHIVQEAEINAQHSRSNVDKAVQTLPEQTYREYIQQLVENSTQELLFAEAEIRKHQPFLTFHDVEQYRNLMNAINETVDTSIILGIDQFEGRLDTIPDNQLSWQTILQKYQWIFNGEFRNSSEKALVLMHNLSMAIQIDDDWYDTTIDQLLGVPSFGIAALQEHNGDNDAAYAFLKDIKSNYLHQARSLGIGYVPSQGITEFVKYSKFLSRKALHETRYAKTEAIRSYWFNFVDKHLGKREKLYIRGELDYQTSSQENNESGI